MLSENWCFILLYELLTFASHKRVNAFLNYNIQFNSIQYNFISSCEGDNMQQFNTQINKYTHNK